MNLSFVVFYDCNDEKASYIFDVVYEEISIDNGMRKILVQKLSCRKVKFAACFYL